MVTQRPPLNCMGHPFSICPSLNFYSKLSATCLDGSDLSSGRDQCQFDIWKSSGISEFAAFKANHDQSKCSLVSLCLNRLTESFHQ